MLYESLEEEKRADELLTLLAKSEVNPDSVSAFAINPASSQVPSDDATSPRWPSTRELPSTEQHRAARPPHQNISRLFGGRPALQGFAGRHRVCLCRAAACAEPN